MVKINSFIRIEKNKRFLERKISEKIIRDLYDLQFILSQETYENIKNNKMNKSIEKFFKIITQFIDVIDEGLKYVNGKKPKTEKTRAYKMKDDIQEVE